MNAHGFERLVQRLRGVASQLPDRRTGDNTKYGMADFVVSAFAVFFTQSPSFLSFQRAMEQARGANNACSLFHLEGIPSDNHIREILDPIAPNQIFGLFDDLYQSFEQTGLLTEMRSIHQTRLFTLDATWYFSSQSRNIHCPNCSCLHHANGQVTHYHSAITPVVVSPGHRQVVPLRPEFITPQDGQEKQDCEINAAKRWLSANAARYQTGNDTLLGDDLYAHQPFCRQVLLHGFHFLFTCKPDSHRHLSGWVAELLPGEGRQTLKMRVKGAGNRWENYEYQWANGVPLTEGEGSLKVNWCQVTVTNGEGQQLYHNSFITDWEINADNVAGLVAAARARWKIENANNNVLKNHGYHLEHNFGHGKQHLSSLLATLNLLAFGLHTLLELVDEGYRLVRQQVGPRQTFFQHVQTLTTYLWFESWEKLLDFMMQGQEIGPYTIAKS